MKKVLFVNACVRPQSRTFALARQVLEKLGGEITEVSLCRENLAPLDWAQLERRNKLLAEQDFSAPMFRHAVQFAQADEIVIAAPYWDLAFPASLRVYFEHVTVTGLTFRYAPEGTPVGMCNAKRLIYVTTAGGPLTPQNLGYDYVKALATTFYGIENVLYFKAENLDIWGADGDGILRAAAEEIKNTPL